LAVSPISASGCGMVIASTCTAGTLPPHARRHAPTPSIRLTGHPISAQEFRKNFAMLWQALWRTMSDVRPVRAELGIGSGATDANPTLPART
ncbi:MAG: hypothetical protein K2Z76_14060, partial [Mycobacterium gordonae]|nr:hypothetical protein [Mycobacterium gordonae]